MIFAQFCNLKCVRLTCIRCAFLGGMPIYGIYFRRAIIFPTAIFTQYSDYSCGHASCCIIFILSLLAQNFFKENLQVAIFSHQLHWWFEHRILYIFTCSCWHMNLIFQLRKVFCKLQVLLISFTNDMSMQILY